MDRKTKTRIKKILGIPPTDDLTIRSTLKNWRLKIGPLVYKKKYDAKEFVNAMKMAGLREGDTILIQSSWAEFYNCTDTPNAVIDELINYIGPNGTLCMACMPLLLNGRVFNLKKTPSRAGLLSDLFRRYPSVIRSRNVRHSVCGMGPNAQFLLDEHHLGETAWDEYSPYFRLSKVRGKVFTIGLGRYWVGTIIHCVEALLRGHLQYYTDMFCQEKTEYKYIDYDGIEKSYWNYDMPESGKKIRYQSFIKEEFIFRKYLHPSYSKISNLQIESYDAKEVIETLTNLARKGRDVYIMPSKKGYKFDK